MAKYFSDPKEFSLSLQHVLDCSVYNQGCDGGYAYLALKFGNEMEIYPESCMPYKVTLNIKKEIHRKL